MIKSSEFSSKKEPFELSAKTRNHKDQVPEIIPPEYSSEREHDKNSDKKATKKNVESRFNYLEISLPIGHPKNANRNGYKGQFKK